MQKNKNMKFIGFIICSLLSLNIALGNEPIKIKAKRPSSTSMPRDPESIPITANLDGNILRITIGSNVGITHIVIGNEDGTNTIHDNILSTPNMINIVVNQTGNHTLTITLSNGEQYYGYFQVEN